MFHLFLLGFPVRNNRICRVGSLVNGEEEGPGGVGHADQRKSIPHGADWCDVPVDALHKDVAHHFSFYGLKKPLLCLFLFVPFRSTWFGLLLTKRATALGIMNDIF